MRFKEITHLRKSKNNRQMVHKTTNIKIDSTEILRQCIFRFEDDWVEYVLTRVVLLFRRCSVSVVNDFVINILRDYCD